MKTICKTLGVICSLLTLGALLLTTRAGASASRVHQSYSQAKVIAHLSFAGGGATQMFLQQEGKTLYLYVQQPAQQGFTVINVTKPGRPKLVRHASIETVTVMGSGLMITETRDPSPAVDASSAPPNADGARPGGTVPESVHLLDVSDSAHPRTVDTFDGVTSILQDHARNLIYLSNGDGVWILSHQQVVRTHNCSSSDAISPIPNCN